MKTHHMHAKTSMNHLLLLILAGMVTFTGCRKDHPVSENPASLHLTPKQQALVYSGNDFGFNVLRLADGANPGKNYCISPLSISAALGMTLNGANGTTHKAMADVLGFSGMTNQEINETYKLLIDYLLNCDPKVVMEIAQSIWYDHGFAILPLFIQVNQQYFYASMHPAHFDDPATVGMINQWVSTKTHGKIPTIVDNIPEQAVMYLINAVYFNAAWKYKFDKSYTQLAPFTLEDGSNVMVDMMRKEGDLEVLKNDLCEAIRMPYGSGKFAMVAVKPAEGKTLTDVLTSLDQSVWNDWNNSFTNATKATLYFPKFKFEYEEKLKDILTSLGMGIAFTPGEADFSRINSSMPLYINEVKHKTFIDVHEEGTEAAAVTAVEICLTSVNNVFTFNEAFLFFIVEKESGFVTFSGKVFQPAY